MKMGEEKKKRIKNRVEVRIEKLLNHHFCIWLSTFSIENLIENMLGREKRVV